MTKLAHTRLFNKQSGAKGRGVSRSCIQKYTKGRPVQSVLYPAICAICKRWLFRSNTKQYCQVEPSSEPWQTPAKMVCLETLQVETAAEVMTHLISGWAVRVSKLPHPTLVAEGLPTVAPPLSPTPPCCRLCKQFSHSGIPNGLTQYRKCQSRKLSCGVWQVGNVLGWGGTWGRRVNVGRGEEAEAGTL